MSGRHTVGPWGAGIRYWLTRLHRSQASLCTAINEQRRRTTPAGTPVRLIQRKTIGAIVRGLHTQTRLLEEIAESLGVPLDALLIAPDHQRHQAHRHLLATEIADQVLRTLDTREPSIEDAITALDRAVTTQEQRAPRRPAKRPAKQNHP